MEQVGFLYVLANSAMPGVVKVGKTTRSPAERASELSGATGLPTAFIVVYEQLFADCGAAESFVHLYLEQQGYRVADNREFFNAPVNLVVKAISLAPGAIDNCAAINDQVAEEDELLPDRNPNEHDELCDLTLEPAVSPPRPWEAVFAEAEYHYYGVGDYLEDHAEALRLYRKAAQLGALEAFSKIGQMYEGGEGTPENKSKALEFYKEGARKGNIYCYWLMGELFRFERKKENAEKCYGLFLKQLNSGSDGEQTINWSRLYFDCAVMISLQTLPAALNGFILDRLSNIRARLSEFQESVEDQDTRLQVNSGLERIDQIETARKSGDTPSLQAALAELSRFSR